MLAKNLIRESVFESMNVVPEDIFKESMMAVADASSSILENTLGPYARTSIIDDGTFKYPTKDGMNVLRRLRFNDVFYQSLLSFILQISHKLVSTVGDGTTTALVAACKFITFYETYVGRNYSRVRSLRQADLVELLKAIANEVEKIINNPEMGLIRKVDTSESSNFDDIYQIAYVSSNGNREVADAIRYLYENTHNPNIYVTIDAVDHLEAEIQKGYKFDGRLLNRKIYANTDSGAFESTESMMVALFDHNITYSHHGKIINMLLQHANAAGKQILIIAPNFDDTFLTLIGTQLNNLREKGQIPSLMMMQGSTSLMLHKQYYQDLSKIAKTECFNKEHIRIIYTLSEPTEENKDAIQEILNTYITTSGAPVTAEDIMKEHIGYLKEVKIDDKQLICAIDSTSDTYKLHLDAVTKEFMELKEKNDHASTPSKDFMQGYLRYSRLLGNLGIIRVGGESDIEKMCLKDSIDDAVLACRSAYEDGYVRGFNLTTLAALDQLKREVESGESELLESFSEDYRADILTLIELFNDTYTAVNARILNNKYGDAENEYITEAGKIQRTCLNDNMVYNLVTDTYESFAEGTSAKVPSVINPARTDIEVFKAIVSILSLLITSNQMITTNKFLGLKKTKADEIIDKANDKAFEASTVMDALYPTLEKLAGAIGIPAFTTLKSFVEETAKTGER